MVVDDDRGEFNGGAIAWISALAARAARHHASITSARAAARCTMYKVGQGIALIIERV
jgi:hypothetical protein